MSWKRGVPDPAEHLVEGARLQPVEPAVEAGRTIGHHELDAAGEGIEQRPEPFGANLEIRRQRHEQITPAALDAQPERGGFTESLCEAVEMDTLRPRRQRHQLRTRLEPAIEDEEKLEVLPAPLQLPGEPVIQGGEVVRSLDHRHHHRDERRRVRRRGQGRDIQWLNQGSLRRHFSSHAAGMALALSRSLLSATSETRPSMNR